MSRQFLFGLAALASVVLTSIPAQAWGHHLHGRIVRYAQGGVYVRISSGAVIFVPFGSEFYLGGAVISIGGPGAYPIGAVIDASYGPGNVYQGYSGGSYYSPTYRSQHAHAGGRTNRGVSQASAPGRGAPTHASAPQSGNGHPTRPQSGTRSQPAAQPQVSHQRSSAPQGGARPAGGGSHSRAGGRPEGGERK